MAVAVANATASSTRKSVALVDLTITPQPQQDPESFLLQLLWPEECPTPIRSVAQARGRILLCVARDRRFNGLLRDYSECCGRATPATGVVDVVTRSGTRSKLADRASSLAPVAGSRTAARERRAPHRPRCR